MGGLTTHVLDTAHGCPASGMAITLRHATPDGTDLVLQATTNADGRCDGPLLEGKAFKAGIYELVFQVGSYFQAKAGGAEAAEPPFLDEVVLRFGVSKPDQHYHVPLLVSPYGYTTYRGS